MKCTGHIKTTNCIEAKTERGDLNERVVLSIYELAEELGVSYPIAYQVARSEGFPSFKIGRRILVSREGLYAWVAKRAGLKGKEVQL